MEERISGIEDTIEGTDTPVKENIKSKKVPDMKQWGMFSQNASNFQNSSDSTCWQRYRARRKHFSIACGRANLYNHFGNQFDCLSDNWKSIWDTAILFLAKNPKHAPLKYRDTCSAIFIAALDILPWNRKQPRWPSNEEWIDKIWYIHTMEYYSAIRNKDIMNFEGKWMEIETIFLSNIPLAKKTSMIHTQL